MKKSELLSAIQNEIQRHDLSTFMSEKHKIVQTGDSGRCRSVFRGMPITRSGMMAITRSAGRPSPQGNTQADDHR
jgi:hypothetical protein